MRHRDSNARSTRQKLLRLYDLSHGGDRLFCRTVINQGVCEYWVIVRRLGYCFMHQSVLFMNNLRTTSSALCIDVPDVSQPVQGAVPAADLRVPKHKPPRHGVFHCERSSLKRYMSALSCSLYLDFRDVRELIILGSKGGPKIWRSTPKHVFCENAPTTPVFHPLPGSNGLVSDGPLQ